MITIIDVLKTLSSGENYLIKVNDYKKIGVDVKDEFNLFERNEVPSPTPFKLLGHDTRTNISVQNKIYGIVKINPRQASKVNLPSTIKTGPIYKTKTIIKDGKLNCGNMDLIVDLNTCLKLTQYGVKFTTINYETTTPGICINLDLSNYGIIDNKSCDMSLDDILNQVSKLNELKAQQKALNYIKKDIVQPSESIPGFSKEQVELLFEHGLNDKLQYTGVDNKVCGTKETYEAEVINFKLKNSSISSIDNICKRMIEGKEIKELDKIEYDTYNNMMDRTSNFGDEDKLFIINNELQTLKSKINSIKFNIVLKKLLMTHSSIGEMAFDTNSPMKYNNLTIEFTKKEFNK